MQIIRQAADLQSGGRKVCVAIGVFDGVHLGHQQVLKQTIADARKHDGMALALTFDRHPSSVLAPSRTPPLIYSLRQKLQEIEALGIDAILVIEFTREFSQTTGEDFVRRLRRDLGRLASISVGSAFTFGYKKSGNIELLQRLGSELGFQVHGLSAVSLGGRIVSSTRIREAITDGDLDAASQMLGRPYSIAGRIVRGDQLGRKLGFPTANVELQGRLTPPNGVYAVVAKQNDSSWRGVANIGVRPTLAGDTPEKRFEVHLFDFNTEIYESELEVTFVAFIRPEQRFASLDELKAQIARDAVEARRLLD